MRSKQVGTFLVSVGRSELVPFIANWVLDCEVGRGIDDSRFVGVENRHVVRASSWGLWIVVWGGLGVRRERGAVAFRIEFPGRTSCSNSDFSARAVRQRRTIDQPTAAIGFWPSTEPLGQHQNRTRLRYA